MAAAWSDEEALLLEQLARRAPAATLQRLGWIFSTHAIALKARAERDELYLLLAVNLPGSARDIASQVHRDLSNYRGSAWRFERKMAPPSEPRRRLMWQILTAADGEVLSAERIRKLLPGGSRRPSGDDPEQPILSQTG